MPHELQTLWSSSRGATFLEVVQRLLGLKVQASATERRSNIRDPTKQQVTSLCCPLLDQPNSSKQKQPFSIGMADDSTFAFAGLWESWTDPRGDVVETCTILTTSPNALVAEVHNRMPVILRVEDYARWLDPSISNPSLLRACLKPFDPDLMKKYPVSTRVNRPENDDHECAQEVPLAVTPTLF